MHFFRNPEITRELGSFLVVMIVAVAGADIAAGNQAAVVVLLVCFLFAGMHFFSSWRRYRKIQEMAQQLDEILHEDVAVLMQECQEGELAILYTQLGKLVRRLREQTEDLQQDKVFLADALADISHQIKTPLTSIHLLLSFLKEEEVSTERRREIAREISVLMERIDWLVYALLKMSRLDAGVAGMKKEQVSLKELADKSYELIAVPMDIRGIQWKTEIQDDASFRGDLAWSIEAVGNILKNCMEHTSGEGCITFKGEENAIYTEIKIQDNGTGIAQEDLPHLFERFYRGKENDSQSVGIGLSLAQKIIQQQNGIIQVKNAEDGGAVFWIRFYKTVV